jgi:hypothetical protein
MEKKNARQQAVRYAINYETRLNSKEYLKTLDPKSSNTNIDFFHLYHAYDRIEKWFAEDLDLPAQADRACDFFSHLLKKVRVIWYKVPSTPNLSPAEATGESIALFTRLNVGRIPLTDAELIKAALLSAVRLESSDRAHEMAAQWDGIERDLHRPDLWAFVAGLSDNEEDEKYPTRISLLLDTMADEKKKIEGKRPRYYTFDTLREEIELNYLGFWKKVVALHAQILGWYEQPSIYNKIGFLVASGKSIVDLTASAKEKKKSEFEKFLIKHIQNRVDVQDVDLEDLKYGDKKRGYPKLLELLLLLNVETITRIDQRFPFFQHVGQVWSLEHIHAQHDEGFSTAQQWKTWLKTHQMALDSLSEHDKRDIELLKEKINNAISSINSEKSGNFTHENFIALRAEVLKILSLDDAPDHSIRNMALLSSSDNSRLNNSVFEVKRQMILEGDRTGKYVPVCTRNVFLKYYAEADAQQPHFWSENDKISYLKAIRDGLKPYLK